jgi:hypothetical protein
MDACMHAYLKYSVVGYCTTPRTKILDGLSRWVTSRRLCPFSATETVYNPNAIKTCPPPGSLLHSPPAYGTLATCSSLLLSGLDVAHGLLMNVGRTLQMIPFQIAFGNL